jgi:hypothetical protein
MIRIVMIYSIVFVRYIQYIYGTQFRTIHSIILYETSLESSSPLPLNIFTSKYDNSNQLNKKYIIYNVIEQNK